MNEAELAMARRGERRDWENAIRPQPSTPAVLLELVRLIPPWGEPWPQKALWLDALRAVLDVIYPEPPSQP